MSKICTKCRQSKDLNQFWFKNKAKNIRRSECHSCVLIYQKEHYARSSARRAKINSANTVNIERNRQFVFNYLKLHPCIDCRESDPRVLEFDHRDRNLKIRPISAMVIRGSGIKTIELEILKCDVRCANCHRRRTALQMNWWKGI